MDIWKIIAFAFKKYKDAAKDMDGDAVAGNVLLDKEFYNTDVFTKETGTMPNNAGDNACLSSSVDGTTLKLVAKEGYTDGVDDAVTVTDADFVAAKIKNGENIFGVEGTYPTPAAGNILVYKNPTEHTRTYPQGGYAVVNDVEIENAGTYRVKFSLKSDGDGGFGAYGRIYKNDVAYGTERQNNTDEYVEYSEDLAFAKNDNIQLYIKGAEPHDATSKDFIVSVAENPLFSAEVL